MTNQKESKYLFPLIIMAVLFFLLGFITTMNNSLIEYLSKAFSLNEVEKQLINTFFYGAYVFSIPVGFLINRIGYKKGVLSGLALVVIGFFLCIPAVTIGYYGFLSAVSVFAFGIVILQVAANPYVNALGSPETAASRLTLTNALNSVATVIAPIFVSMIIVSAGPGESNLDPKAVQMPFAGIGTVTFLILVVLFFLKLPEIKTNDKTEANSKGTKYKSSAFKYLHLWLGSLAIFFYMGIEIGIPSFLGDYSNKLGFSFDSMTKTDILKYYWGGLMIGRVAGIFILRKYSARSILGISAVGGASLIALSLLIGGGEMKNIALALFLGSGLFHSIMWPTIFNLSLEDLGPNAKVGSGVIATSVIGAALLPPLMGTIQKSIVGNGLILAISCMFVYYGYLVFFALKGSKLR